MRVVNDGVCGQGVKDLRVGNQKANFIYQQSFGYEEYFRIPVLLLRIHVKFTVHTMS